MDDDQIIERGGTEDDIARYAEREGGSSYDQDISLCPSCSCMTHTVNGKCGKCGDAKKPSITPTAEQVRATFPVVQDLEKVLVKNGVNLPSMFYEAAEQSIAKLLCKREAEAARKAAWAVANDVIEAPKKYKMVGDGISIHKLTTDVAYYSASAYGPEPETK